MTISSLRFAVSRIIAAIVISIAMTSTAQAQNCSCPADVVQDGFINVDDLLGVINAWGRNPGHPGDVTGNGFVNVDDLLAVINAWGTTCTIPGVFPASWIHGAANCAQNPGPSIQVHQYNADTYILRQSKCTNYEGPFMYLFFGSGKVLMQDTGASNIPLASTVYGIINQWLIANNQASIQLIVSHSHGHGDHTFCDSQFIGQPNTTVVGTSQTAVRNFFGITTWPTQIVPYDLGGGRVVDVIPIPGHQSASIALYDRQTGLLLTGDTLYPGRLYIATWSEFKASIQRLVTFAQGKPICHVLGTHIEMSNTPGVDYPIGSTYQPNEHILQLTLSTLIELNNACVAMGNSPFYQVHNDFIIFP